MQSSQKSKHKAAEQTNSRKYRQTLDAQAVKDSLTNVNNVNVNNGKDNVDKGPIYMERR